MHRLIWLSSLLSSFTLFSLCASGSENIANLSELELREYSVELSGMAPGETELQSLLDVMEISTHNTLIDIDGVDGLSAAESLIRAQQEGISAELAAVQSSLEIVPGYHEKLRNLIFSNRASELKTYHVVNLTGYLSEQSKENNESAELLHDMYTYSQEIAEHLAHSKAIERIDERVRNDIWENATSGKYSVEFLRELANNQEDRDRVSEVYKTLPSDVLSKDVAWFEAVARGISISIRLGVLRAAQSTQDELLMKLVESAAQEQGDYTPVGDLARSVLNAQS